LDAAKLNAHARSSSLATIGLPGISIGVPLMHQNNVKTKTDSIATQSGDKRRGILAREILRVVEKEVDIPAEATACASTDGGDFSQCGFAI